MMPESNETLLRQILAGQAVQDAKIENISERLENAAIDARTARDLANRTNTILEEQNIVARFGELRTEVRQAMTEIRQDFVAANTKLRNDLDALAARVKVLEDDRQQREGIKSLAAWLMKNAPWLFAGIAAFVAGMGLEDKIK